MCGVEGSGVEFIGVSCRKPRFFRLPGWCVCVCVLTFNLERRVCMCVCMGGTPGS